MDNISIYACGNDIIKAKEIAEKLNIPFVNEKPSSLHLFLEKGCLSLTDGQNSICGDFSKLLRRVKPNNINTEFMVKAAKIKGLTDTPTAVDATAGLGEDSFLLAGAGYNVILFERDPIISALLQNTIERALANPEISEIAGRMTAITGDSIEELNKLSFTPDLVLLDPMFPERNNSALVKKKFQLIHHLEAPCDQEQELLSAAINANPRRILIKRPLKGSFLADKKPSYSLKGKAIRLDCIVLPR